jgi:hypothetical protein
MVPGKNLSGNARVHWGSRNREARALRQAAITAVWQGLTGAEREWLFFGHSIGLRPRMIYDCEITWPRGRKSHDDDNCWQMVKPARDGVAEAAHINDSTFQTGVMTQVRATKDAPGHITFTFRRYDPAL